MSRDEHPVIQRHLMDQKSADIPSVNPSEDSCSHECAGCPSAGACPSAKAASAAKADIDVKHVILVLSGKGGVGKSTISVNLAYALSSHGYQVGLLDLDIHGPNIPKMLGIEDHRLTMLGNRINRSTSPGPFLLYQWHS